MIKHQIIFFIQKIIKMKYEIISQKEIFEIKIP